MASTYVFDLNQPEPSKAWAEFDSLTIDDAIILSRGEVDDNLNLFLNSGSLEKYPGGSYTIASAHIKTKAFEYDVGILKKFAVEFEGSSITVDSYMENQTTATTKNQTFSTLTTDEWQGVDPLYARGERLSFKIADADIIQSMIFRVKAKGV